MNEELNNKKIFIINSLEQAKIAIKINQGKELSLLSPYNSVIISGPSFFINLKQEIERLFDNLTIIMWIDCGKSPGLALNVIREGGKNIIFNNDSISAIQEIAYLGGVNIVNSIPDVIDLSKNNY